jgi:hypothetical protein
VGSWVSAGWALGMGWGPKASWRRGPGPIPPLLLPGGVVYSGRIGEYDLSQVEIPGIPGRGWGGAVGERVRLRERGKKNIEIVCVPFGGGAILPSILSSLISLERPGLENPGLSPPCPSPCVCFSVSSLPLLWVGSACTPDQAGPEGSGSLRDPPYSLPHPGWHDPLDLL